MRILQLSQFYDPIIGGEEAHVRTLGRCLADRGHEVTLITYATADDAGRTMDEGVEIIRIRPASSSIPFVYTDPSWPHALPVPDPVVARAIARFVRERRPDVAHAHNWISNSAVGVLHRAGVPLVTSLHDYSQRCPTKRYRYLNDEECTGPGLRKCLRCSADKYGAASGAATFAGNAVMSRRRRDRTAQFMSVSNAVARRSTDTPGSSPVVAGVPSVVLPNFIPDELVVEDIPQPAADAPIVFVGDLTKDKGADVLVRAYRQLADPPAMVMVGRITPETPDPLPDGVRATGPLPHAQAMAHVLGARVQIVPSTWQDPCPTVVLEGMAMGRPVVASAAGGITDMVVDGETGSLFPPGDADALAAALSAVLADPDRAAAMGAAGRDRVRAFTVSAVVDRLETIYAECVERGRGAGVPETA